MTVKEIFDLRKQGRIEEAYDAIRPMYRVHKGYYTSLCMYHCAKDVFHLCLAEGRIDEAEKIYLALQKLVPFIGDKDGTVSKFMSEANARLADAKNALQGHNNLAKGLGPGSEPVMDISSPCRGDITKPGGLPLGSTPDTTPKIQRLLNILDGEMSVREMMAAMGFASRDKFLKNYLSPALKAGLVVMTDPDSPKSPKQKYKKTKL